MMDTKLENSRKCLEETIDNLENIMVSLGISNLGSRLNGCTKYGSNIHLTKEPYQIYQSIGYIVVRLRDFLNIYNEKCSACWRLGRSKTQIRSGNTRNRKRKNNKATVKRRKGKRKTRIRQRKESRNPDQLRMSITDTITKLIQSSIGDCSGCKALKNKCKHIRNRCRKKKNRRKADKCTMQHLKMLENICN